MINKLADSQGFSSAQMAKEMSQMRQELREMKETINHFKQKTGRYSQRRSLFFRSRRRSPAPVEPEKPKPAVSVEDLLPLLPHLSNAFPQLKNPKVADSIKVLSNPAVLSIIQQFITNGGLQALKGKSVTPVNRRERRFFP